MQRPMRGFAVSLMALSLVACGGDKKEKPNPHAAPAAAEAKTDDPKTAPKKVAVHGDKGAATNPHAGGPVPPSNPHAGMPGGGRVVPTTQPPASAPQDIKPDGKTTQVTVDGLSFAVPAQWERQPPANRMRIDQYDVPGPGGGASLGVFRFPGGGGSAQANIDRWVGQFDQPDGKPSKEVAKIETQDVGGLSVTTVSVTGTYQGAMSMRGQATAKPLEDAQLLAAIVAGSGDPYFFKLSGPAKTVGVWSEQWAALVASFKQGAAAPAGEAKAP